VDRRLLIRPGAIGDVILSLPELEAARAEYTEVWAQRAVLPLIRFADRTRAIADTGLDLIGIADGAPLDALRQFDSIYSWYGTERPEFREAVRDLPFTFFPPFPLQTWGTPVIEVPAAPVEDFAAIHPFSGSAKKNWPMENFQAFADRLHWPVQWIAGPDDTLDGAVHIGDLYRLACRLHTARVYIGNDSGISHLAAAAGAPVVAIFLSTDPVIWAPRGPRVIVLENPTVDQVVDAAHCAVLLR
jgi:heptosyltransferase III